MDVKMPSAVRGSDSISAEFPSSNKEKQRTLVMEILFYSSIFFSSFTSSEIHQRSADSYFYLQTTPSYV
ncbi:hypothetical protein OWV82_006825 [Melia azedarach]|uniref:Uncharacterized protein n=1 Tax=Melia azedarach TaxID=155640 RepID=A0ACC1YJS4_MELAZ|nr:hypothetical protein OWV82_006825 [Melia azedarach]